MALRQGGFTYLGLVITLAIVGMVGAAALKVDALLRRAAAEQELLETGAAFSEALKSYADATPRGQPAQPPSLKELLKDPRFPGVRRHLRKIFIDPVTGRAEWGIVWANPGNETGVLAVYSLSQAQPLKQANFDARFANLEGKEHLSEWKFGALGQAIVQPGQGVQQAGQPGQPAPQPSLFPAPQPAQPAPPTIPPVPEPVPAPEPSTPAPPPATADDAAPQEGDKEDASAPENKDGQASQESGRR